MGDSKDILLINRDSEFISQTANLLGQAGYTVHTAMEMRGALTVFSVHPVRLILCDKDLQDISGYDFLDFQREGSLEPLKGIEYLLTVCKALDFISKKNIIHRDIKPGNIMLNEKGIIKIVDFGVAKVKDASKQSAGQEAIMGSPLYISPDTLAGRPLDHRSDIYSLGATFYHLFTGYPPFEGDSVKDILDQHMTRPLIPMKEKNSNVSNALGRIIKKMMAKDPNERYQDYQSIIRNLRACVFVL